MLVFRLKLTNRSGPQCEPPGRCISFTTRNSTGARLREFSAPNPDIYGLLFVPSKPNIKILLTFWSALVLIFCEIHQILTVSIHAAALQECRHLMCLMECEDNSQEFSTIYICIYLFSTLYLYMYLFSTIAPKTHAATHIRLEESNHQTSPTPKE